ncbi:17830_t:CDS:1, partial [Cetraspora pellucida]
WCRKFGRTSRKMTHASLTPAHREAVGVTDNLIRLSVCIEDINDL